MALLLLNLEYLQVSNLVMGQMIQVPDAKLMSLNIQSILAKKASFDNLMDDYSSDIVAISETWLSTDISSNEFFPKGYYH